MARPRRNLDPSTPITVWLSAELAAAVERTGLLADATLHAALLELIRRGCDESSAWRELGREGWLLRPRPSGFGLDLTLHASDTRDVSLLDHVVQMWKARPSHAL